MDLAPASTPVAKARVFVEERRALSFGEKVVYAMLVTFHEAGGLYEDYKLDVEHGAAAWNGATVVRGCGTLPDGSRMSCVHVMEKGLWETAPPALPAQTSPVVVPSKL